MLSIHLSFYSLYMVIFIKLKCARGYYPATNKDILATTSYIYTLQKKRQERTSLFL